MASIIYLSVCLLALSQLTVGKLFRDCGSTKGSIVSMTVTPCDTKPCSLYKGKNATITIDFKTSSAVTKASAIVHGILSHIPVPFPLDNPDVCKFVTPSCPLKPSEAKYTYNYTMLTSTSYPSIRVGIKWELQDEDGNDIVCVEFPAQIV
uniref:ML domain-containing protein n=2 Tax=Trichobilharzia regenti TaxID=157069 RepID=A0AA85JN65_TRIRE|nr:unnamed protein product [Trichobilharzia regenti]